ncbi:hypothetical protein ABDD95_07735 [Mucilaginibacter sp. PAMB04274]|uniref:hypothetical protein n=1 Tax=Mucilaginibacter sp. PAMB04274 TaxID=3138568 RepID=UPI0031F6F893
MSSTDINYKEFVKYVHDHFADQITIEEVNEILYLKQGYNKDSPTSLGKSLVLNRLRFSGQKINGDNFIYDKPLFKGINVWIADNHKGKSTIFKIIKFAITGTDSIKRDIKNWIHEILLEFHIGQVVYTCYIDRRGRDRGALYRLPMAEFLTLRENQKLDDAGNDVEFEFRSMRQYEEKIQDFFFEQFSFYTLKYTQKNSSKEEFELNTANLSWTTYFKSIYLESSNYEYLFFDNENYGAQGKKIFEMILGLPLTYPINMLGIQLDKVSEEIGRIRLTDKTRSENTSTSKKILEENYQKASAELREAEKLTIVTFSEKAFVAEYSTIQNKVNEVRRQQRIAEDAYRAEQAKQRPYDEELSNLLEDKQKIQAEITRLSKQEINVELYRQAESFFTNLDIKLCPHCETEVSEHKKEKEHVSHACSLCGETPTEQKIDEEELKEKAERIKQEINGHSARLVVVDKQILDLKLTINQLKITVANLYNKVIAVPSVHNEVETLKELEDKIEAVNRDRKNQQGLFDKKEQLIKEKAVLEFQLEELQKQKHVDNTETLSKLLLRKEILEYALIALGKKRSKLNKKILNILEDLILNEVNAFGLTSITKVDIDDKFNLSFTQNTVSVDFNEMEPGEKLRVKLGFYLSLIQLDIEHNLGRHPRFLIFDSPGSEEMVPKHLQGLSEILKKVNSRFNNQLQILIGSALREFEQITEPEKSFVKDEVEFVF